MAPTYPYVCILDWDGTVVGKVDFQSQAFTLIHTLRRMGIKTPPMNTSAFSKDHKLVRPYFADFIKTLQRFYSAEGGMHFFIYTASMKTWAIQEIGWVERAHDVAFDRPIFTRDECQKSEGGSYTKSIAKIYPRICKSLGLVTKEARDYVLEHQLMIIDNRAVYTDHVDKLLLCPDYDYAVFENLLDYIPASATKDAQSIIYGLVNGGLLCPSSGAGGASGATGTSGDKMRALAKSYAWLATKCEAISEANKVYESDDFWRYIRKLITQNHLKTMNANVIKQLQTAAWQHAKRVTRAARTA